MCVSAARCSDHVVEQGPRLQAEADASGGVHVQRRSGVREQLLELVVLQPSSKPTAVATTGISSLLFTLRVCVHH